MRWRKCFNTQINFFQWISLLSKISLSNKEDCIDAKVDILICESCEDCKRTDDAPRAAFDSDEPTNIEFSLEYFGLRRHNLEVNSSVSSPPPSPKLLKCHLLCERSEKHQRKHKVDISSPLGQLITQKDAIDEIYKQAKQNKIESFCGHSMPTTKASKSKRGRASQFENPVLAEMRNSTRQYYKKF